MSESGPKGESQLFAAFKDRDWKGRLFGSRVRKAAWALLLIPLLYYPVGALMANRVDDDVAFQASEVESGSRAVAMAAALVEREVDANGWVANNPWFFPSAVLDNMPNFQMGLVYAVSRFAIEMTDYLGRTRGTSQADPDLDKASGLLKYDGTIWMWEPTTSLMPTASAERQYIAAVKALRAYNSRVASGEATYDKRADSLIAFMDRISSDLGSASAALDERAFESNAAWFDTKADDIFYAVKGRLYGYYMLLRAIGVDFQDVLAERKAENVWQRLLETMRTAAEMDPLIVSNGANDGLIAPSHLTAQGFYLLRTRAQLGEVTSILLK